MSRKLLLIIAVAILLCYSGLIEPYWITVRTYHLSIEGLQSDEIRVVHLADIHTTRLGRREKWTIKTVEQLRPDYVFVTGDLLKSVKKVEIGPIFLSKLKASRAVYAVPGNADVALINAINQGVIPKESLNYRILMNESVDCGSFTLVGINDPVKGKDDVSEAFKHVANDKPIFVMSHFHPERLLSEIEKRGADIIFSGHTHGGQIGHLPLITLIPRVGRSTYMAGLYTLDNAYLHVSKGVGTNILPFRLLCRPEITVIHLRGK